jgi:hypothetical protein
MTGGQHVNNHGSPAKESCSILLPAIALLLIFLSRQVQKGAADELRCTWPPLNQGSNH